MTNKAEYQSLLEMADHVIFNQGWSRYLQAEKLGKLVRIRATTDPPDDFTETDIVALYSEEEFLVGSVRTNDIHFDCRRFLQDNDLLK